MSDRTSSDSDIRRLDAGEIDSARAILEVSLASYAVEAEWLGVEDFPPLRETVERVRAADSIFYGLEEEGRLAAVCELARITVEVEGAEAEGAEGEQISRLVVHPDFFRRGLASRLLRHVLDRHGRPLHVSTGADNTAALALYRRFGFEPITRRAHAEGIEIVDLVLG